MLHSLVHAVCIHTAGPDDTYVFIGLTPLIITSYNMHQKHTVCSPCLACGVVHKTNDFIFTLTFLQRHLKRPQGEVGVAM